MHFLSIHPFIDGNGRMSRALTVLLMLKNNYSYMPYASMESMIEANKDAYYRALCGTQKQYGVIRSITNHGCHFCYFFAKAKKSFGR